MTLSNVDTLNDVRTHWGGTDVAVIADSACPSLGVPADTGILSDPTQNPDLAILASAPEAPAVARLHMLQQHPVAAHGSTRSIFWEQVLQPIAAGAHTATLLDGYLFRRLSEINHGHTSASNVDEHVVWLLRHLDRVMAQGATVRLIANTSGVQAGDDAEVMARAIRDRWTPKKDGRLAQVEVLLRRRTPAQPFPHDRHIRFSTGGAIKVPAGFDRLREAGIWDPSGMWWAYHWESGALGDLRNDERAAEGLPGSAASVSLDR